MSQGLGLDAYLVCATPRTGSTLLCDLLESSGVAGHPASYFRRQDLNEYAAYWGLRRPDGARIDHAFVRAAVSAGSTPNGVCGVRVMRDTLPELVDALTVLATGPVVSDQQLLTNTFGRVRFVHLRRLAVVAQAVSWARSLQTHFWHPGEEVAPGAQNPHYDEDLIGQLVARITELELGWKTWFEHNLVVPHEVVYEELSADPTGTARGVLGFLGLELPTGTDLVTAHRRQADQLNRNWIARFSSR